MYAAFFGLQQEPFSIAPDPRYLFMSERHREALAHLLYGVRGGGGFVLLTGEIGAGKTTVCRCFLEQIPKRCNVAYVFNPKLTVPELLQTVCHEFHIPEPEGVAGQPPTVKAYVDALNEFLLRTHAVGQNNVLIIDEAQNLAADVLEQLRLLTNLETSERKLLQIVLIGQPELRTMVARPELEQLAQRVIARYHLEALSPKECGQYVRHRLHVAGLSGPLPFERDALARLQVLSRGVPRRINLLADRALLGAYGQGRAKVDALMVEQAASEVFGTPAPQQQRAQRRRLAVWAGAGSALALAAGAGAWALWPAAPGGGMTAAVRPVPAASSAAAAAPATAATASAAASTPAAPASAAPAALALLPLSTPLHQAFPMPVRDEAEAWRQLGAAWQLPVPDSEPCTAWARAQQVQCFRGPGSLAVIRTLDRPGLLSLRDADGASTYALLTGLDDMSATLRMGTTTQRVSLAWLAAVWKGDFATLWRAPAGYQRLLVDGSTGPAVQALAEQLARAAGEPAPPPGARVDANFKARVAAFQLAQGLRADGVAGPETFMQLNRVVGIAEPRLAGAAAIARR